MTIQVKQVDDVQVLEIAAKAKEQFILTANYHDRSSPYKWLVRRSDQLVEEAVACKSVVADEVIMGAVTTEDLESEFGCVSMACCRRVTLNGASTDDVATALTSPLNKLSFRDNGSRPFRFGDERLEDYISYGQRLVPLVCLPDGSSYARRG